jgi:heme/copper-type cytochrome/quinol oxidase subunit 4
MPAPPQLFKMPPSPRGVKVRIEPYLLGAVLALVLTAIPFGLVATRTLRQL